MLLLHKNLQKGELKVTVQSHDDLWYLSHIVDIGDSVKGQTFRKIKIGSDENAKVIKKKVFLKILVDKIEFHKYTHALRIGGGVTEGPEDIARGSHHTFNVEEKTTISIEKPGPFLSFQIDKIKEASENKPTDCIVVALDRDSAFIALLKKYGYEILSSLSGDVAKKMMETTVGKNFYAEVVKVLLEYVDRYSIKHLVIGSPGFWKEELAKHIEKSELKSKVKIVYATCSADGKKAIAEILKRPETQQVLQNERTSLEMVHVEKLLVEISHGKKAAYGIGDCSNAANLGAVEVLLVTDSFIQKMRDEESYEKLDSVLMVTEQTKGKIVIVSSDHDGGKKLDGLGGIGALLRYAI